MSTALVLDRFCISETFDLRMFTKETSPETPSQVKTGSVMSRKISLLTRAGSLEPEVDFTESPAPKRRTVRFAGLDSPSPTMTTGRRPKVGLGPIVSVSYVS